MQQKIPLKGLGHEMNNIFEGLKFKASLIFHLYSVQQQVPLKGLGHEMNKFFEGLQINAFDDYSMQQ